MVSTHIFDDIPPPWEEVTDLNIFLARKNILHKEVCKLLQKEIIEQAQVDYAGYISSIFSTLKSYRLE